MNATAYASREILTEQGTVTEIFTWEGFTPKMELITTVNHAPFKSLAFERRYFSDSGQMYVRVYRIKGWTR